MFSSALSYYFFITLLRTLFCNQVLIEDLHAMLNRSPELIEGVVEISHQRKWLDLSISAIKFAQCVIQAQWTNNHSLEQLPYITENEVKIITKTPKPQARTLGEYLEVPDEEKKGLTGLTAEQRAEVLRVCNILPHLKVETKLFVEEEELDFLADSGDAPAAATEDCDEDTDKANAVTGDQIYEQDLVTLRITLTRQNVSEGATAPPVYAPFFPKTVRENWWIVLTDKANRPESDPKRNANVNIHAFEKVSDQGRKVVHEVRFMAPQRAGSYEMELKIFSDCYLGLDHVIAVPFDVLPASQLPEYKPHPEDLELDNEPTLFEQVMAANVDEDSEDEDDGEEEEEEDTKKGKKAAIKGGPAAKGGKSSVVVEDVSDSEEED